LVEAPRVEYSGDKAQCGSRIFGRCLSVSTTVLTAFEFVSGDGSSEALLCRRTGRVYWRSAAAGVDEIGDELPEGAEDDPNYIAIPRKQVLGLGKALALDFAREFLPKDYEDVRDMFGRRGAYRNFRALVTKRRVLERWKRGAIKR
jgi:hypothetical protein